jgi:hypothetical protein
MLRLPKLDHQDKERVLMSRWEVRIRVEVREVEAAVDDNVVMTITVRSSFLSWMCRWIELMVKKRDTVYAEQTANMNTMPMSSFRHRR